MNRSILDKLSAAASGVFPGSRVTVNLGVVEVRVVDAEGKVQAHAESPINTANYPRDPNAIVDATANAVMAIARSRFYNTKVE